MGVECPCQTFRLKAYGHIGCFHMYQQCRGNIFDLLHISILFHWEESLIKICLEASTLTKKWRTF